VRSCPIQCLPAVAADRVAVGPSRLVRCWPQHPTPARGVLGRAGRTHRVRSRRPRRNHYRPAVPPRYLYLHPDTRRHRVAKDRSTGTNGRLRHRDGHQRTHRCAPSAELSAGYRTRVRRPQPRSPTNLYRCRQGRTGSRTERGPAGGVGCATINVPAAGAPGRPAMCDWPNRVYWGRRTERWPK
jgi:hypothetical protein